MADVRMAARVVTTPQTPASSPLGGAGQDDGRVLTEGESGGALPSTAPVTMDDLYSLPQGTVLYKPELNGWTLFLKVEGYWRIIDAYDRSQCGKRYSPAAVGCFSPGYVVHRAPRIGYYSPPDAAS